MAKWILFSRDRIRIALSLALAVAFGLSLVACGPSATPVAPEPTAPPEEPTATEAPPAEAPTQAPAEEQAPDKHGGTAVIALIQEPGMMNQFFNVQSATDLSIALVQEPLFRANADGVYEPLLAAEVPSLENGGISEDYLTITYRLRDGITWSDGEPFTADDLVFTFDVYKNPESVTQARPEFAQVESVTAIDDLTVEVKMSEINPGFLELWRVVLPAYMFDSTAVTPEHPQARLPLGTGPFVFTDWIAGDRIELERNPNYWRDPELPYLDGITIKITPQKEAAIASYLAGEYDTLYFFVTGDLPQLQEAQDEGADIALELQENPSWVEWLWLNMSNYGDLSQPHPILGDPAIRAAIDYGVDRQAIIDEVLGGFGSLTNSLVYAGWAAADIPLTPYDPDMAMQILDEAGWVPGDDGIRVKDGQRASLKYQTISGDVVRELYQQIVQANMQQIGIEFVIENVPSTTMFAGYEEGGLLATGDYDIMMSRDGYYIEPTSWVYVFTEEFIPTEEHPSGFTYSHWVNPEFEALVAEARSTLDQSFRKELYQQASEIFAQERPAIPLYSSAWGWSWLSSLKGVSADYWDGIWPSAEEWYLEQ